MAKRETLRKRLGEPPIGDSLAVVSWSIEMLGGLLAEVLDEVGLAKPKRRRELLAIVDRIAKLRDVDRLARAERKLVEADQHQADTKPGPELTDAGDLSQSARPLATRRAEPRS